MREEKHQNNDQQETLRRKSISKIEQLKSCIKILINKDEEVESENKEMKN